MTPETTAQRTAPGTDRLLAYVADLELEVDRLRRHGQFVERQTTSTLACIIRLCSPTAGAHQPPVAEIRDVVQALLGVMRDLHEPPGYHPANDQVVAIAVRPLAQQVFRWQQRLEGAPDVALRLELETDHVEWFPARLRHILDNLLSNALRYRDPAKAEMWVELGLRASATAYELRVSDNGRGLPPGDNAEAFELFVRAAPARAAARGVGVAVVRLLLKQSGGTLTVDSGEGQGTTFLAVLPRYDVDDFLL